MPAIEHADVVIIGGGIIGCSIACHLARAGRRDVVVLEKSALTHGATWHAAGLIGQLRGTRNATRMIQRSVEVYDNLGEESGLVVDWKKVGSLRIASSAERMRELRQMITMARSFGVECELITAGEAQKLFPLMATDGVFGAAYIPADGYGDPNSITQALARSARNHGARFIEDCRVTGISTHGRTVSDVATTKGTWTCNTLVLAAGMWSRELGLLSGVTIPACALEHQYVVTERIPDMPEGMPTMRDPDRLVYYKPDVGALAIGGYEPDTKVFAPHGVPADFARQLLPNDMERFAQLAEKAGEITPIVNEIGIRAVINGPIPESADGDFVMGRAAGFDNYYVATGFLYGIAAGGGAGDVMAQWIMDGAPREQLWSLDVQRFHPVHNTPRVLYARAVEQYADHYKLKYPGRENRSARQIRLSPLHRVLEEHGAVFGSKCGWERPNWYCSDPVGQHDELAYDRDQCNWFAYVRREALAVRTGVALVDQTSFSKLEVGGPGALQSMQYLCAANVDKPPGSVIYTQMCNAGGGIVADLTVTRLGLDTFYVVTGAGFGTHDFDWIDAHLPRNGSVRTRDLTSSRAVINLCGPLARKVLERVTDADVSAGTFRFATAKRLALGSAPDVLAVRVSYTGELGWELHVPSEFANHVYAVLREAGQEFGIIDVGYRAVDSLRMEKGFLYWSADVTPDYSPVEAGLSGRVHLSSKGDFIGRPVLEAQKRDGVRQRLRMLSSSGVLPVYGGEPVMSGNRIVGRVTSANYGFAVKRTIALAYLPVDLGEDARLDVEAFTERHAFRLESKPLYDPESTRLRD